MRQGWDLLIRNVHLATMREGYGEIRHGAIAVKDGRIAWLVPERDAAQEGSAASPSRPRAPGTPGGSRPEPTPVPERSSSPR